MLQIYCALDIMVLVFQNLLYFFLRNSTQLEVNIRIVFDYEDLCNLREFVQNIQPNNVLTSLSVSIGRRSNVASMI
jgi:hypothetical protein